MQRPSDALTARPGVESGQVVGFSSGSSSAGPSSSRRVVVASAAFEPSTLLAPFKAVGNHLVNLSPNEKAVASALLACGTTVIVFQGYRKYWRRIRSVDHVLPRMLQGKTWVRGTVTSVGDADNFRFFHTPPLWRLLRRVPKDAKGLRNETLHIRIAGVDAPEAAHFGRPAQPLSAEALQYLKYRIEGRSIKCLLLSKDQYGRVVAQPMVPRPWLPFLPSRSLSLMMLRDGWATVYRAGGAQYGKLGMAVYNAAEADAKKRKKGIWSLGKKLEAPSAYKRRMASGDLSAQPGTVAQERAPGMLKRAWAGLVKLMTE